MYIAFVWENPPDMNGTEVPIVDLYSRIRPHIEIVNAPSRVKIYWGAPSCTHAVPHMMTIYSGSRLLPRTPKCNTRKTPKQQLNKKCPTSSDLAAAIRTRDKSRRKLRQLETAFSPPSFFFFFTETKKGRKLKRKKNHVKKPGPSVYPPPRPSPLSSSPPAAPIQHCMYAFV